MTRSPQYLVALRIARRDALRHRGRSVLVAVMIALPVVGLAGADVLARTMQLSTKEKIERSMGQADAALTVAGGHVTQTLSVSAGGWSSDGANVVFQSPAYRAILDRARRLLPPGSRLVEHPLSTADVGVAGRRATDIEVDGLDLRDPITEGIASIRSGRAPNSPGEVAITPTLADRLHVGVGDDLTLGPHSRTVVGIVHDPQALSRDAVYELPTALDSSPQSPYATILVDTPSPVTWRDVQRLNAVGVAVDSREVLEHPPAGVPAADSSTLAARAQAIGVATVAVGLAVLEVVLLAGATFAVGARRQRRDLALVAAAGGDEATIRRVVLSGGLVLGGVGTVAGVALGVVAGWSAMPVATRLADADPGHFDLRPLELAAIAVVGLATGLAAAALPARAAGREDVVAALTGRRGIVRTARRVPVAGLAMIMLGAVSAAYAAHPPARFTLVLAGAVVAEIGFVVCAPAVVGAAGRAARSLPLTWRLAVRDASRHRTRTGPAVAAVLAAVAGSVAVSSWITSTIADQRQSYQPVMRIGQTAVQTVSEPGHDALGAADVVATIRADLPATSVVPLSTTQCFGDCRTTFVSPPPSTACDGHASCAENLIASPTTLAVGGSDVLDEVLGRHDAAATAALERGELVVVAPNLAPRGSAELVTPPRASGDTRRIDVRAHVVDAGGHGILVGGVMSTSTAARLHVASYPWGYLVHTTRVPTQGEVDTAQADLSGTGNVMVERGYHPERWNYGLLALAGAAALVTLGATAIATALAATDTMPDLVTLGAIGAAPRLRRRFAATQSATVAILGAVLGAAAGLIPAWAVIHAHGGMPFALPWQTLGVTVVGIPLLAAGATAALTRSRLPSERRTT